MEQGDSHQSSRFKDFTKVHFPIINFIEHSTDEGQTKLQTHRFPAKDSDATHPPKGVIIQFHGYGSYTDKFAYIAKEFVDQGYDVVGCDYKGFGYSGGTRGLITNTDSYIRENYEFVAKAKEFYANLYPSVSLPFVSFGYSLGGAVVVGVERVYGTKDKPVFDAHILVVPNMGLDPSMVFPEEKMNEIRELAKSKPDHALFPFNPTRPDWLEQYYNDELQYQGPVLAGTFVVSMNELAEDNQKKGAEFERPVFIAIGEHDNLVSPVRVKEFYEKIATPPELKELKQYDTVHYIMSDALVFDQVIADQLAFLKRVFKH